MRLIFGLVLVAGLALAGFAVVMAKNYIAGYQARLAAANSLRDQIVKTVDVYVSTRPLAYGEPLAKADVTLVRWPEAAIPEGAFTAEGALFPDTTDKPRMILRAMEKGEAILAVKVTEPGEDAGITSRLAPGMRAFAIKVDVTSGVSGFLRPGDRIDIYWTGRIEVGDRQQDRGEVTKLIESTVPLIAVDQSANGELSGAMIARTVTVAVRPEQVASLAQAQSTGRLSLSLVGTQDDTVASAVQVDQRSLLGLTETPVAAAAAPERVCVRRERRGTEVIEVPVACTN